MTQLGENIKKFRISSNLKQEELAQKLGKSKNVISNWERGDNKPDADMIEKMCKIFQIEPNQIYGWILHRKPSPPISAVKNLLRKN